MTILKTQLEIKETHFNKLQGLCLIGMASDYSKVSG